MALEGTQEPELLAKARGRLCSLLQVEQDTAVGSSFSGFSSVPEVNSNPACTLRDGRGRAERAPVGCGISRGLSPASATLQPWDFGQSTPGPQRPFLHLQSEDSSAKHPTWPFCGAKMCSFAFKFFENSNAVHQCQPHVLLFSPSSPPLVRQLGDLPSATLAASSGLLHEKLFQPQRLFLTTHEGSKGLQSQGKRKSKHRCLTGPAPQLRTPGRFF